MMDTMSVVCKVVKLVSPQTFASAYRKAKEKELKEKEQEDAGNSKKNGGIKFYRKNGGSKTGSALSRLC